MSITKTTTIRCDAPGCITVLPIPPDMNTSDARAAAYQDGWRSPDWGPGQYNSGNTSRDICPGHVASAIIQLYGPGTT